MLLKNSGLFNLPFSKFVDKSNSMQNVKPIITTWPKFNTSVYPIMLL